MSCHNYLEGNLFSYFSCRLPGIRAWTRCEEIILLGMQNCRKGTEGCEMIISHAIPYSPCFRQNPLSLSSPFLPSRQGSNEPHESWYAITLCGMWYRSLALFLLPVLSKPPSSSFLTSLPFTSFSSSVLAFFSFAYKSMSFNTTLTTQFKPEAVCQC